jgi:hypothetical protein
MIKLLINLTTPQGRDEYEIEIEHEKYDPGRGLSNNCQDFR